MAGDSDWKTQEGARKRSEHAAELFADALARVEGGEEVDLRALAIAHPAYAEELERLRERWRQLEEGMAEFAGAPDPAQADQVLLDSLKEPGRRPDRYRRIAEVARGGMGAIIEVFDRDLDRLSAMKVADLGSAVGSKGRHARLARFLREARITGRLEHPGIVPVHDLGIDPEERPFFTMPLVRGHDLRAVFAWVHEGRADWSLARVLGVLLKVCEAVSYAHSRGVLHRDLKPANIMVGRYGEVHVMDWGLAKMSSALERDPLTDSWSTLPPVDALDGSPLHTREGDVLGTPSYMPPEQAAGRLEAVDARADVYAIGAMMYHLLAGESPYGDRPGSSSARGVLTSVVSRPPTPLSELAPNAPPEQIAICERAMAREIADRYPSVEAMGDDLRALLEGRVVTAYERGNLARLRKWVQRNRASAALLAALAVALPLAASLGTYAIATRDDVIAAERHAREVRVEAALEEGYLELGEGDPRLAIEFFEAALSDDPGSLEAIAGRTIGLMRLGDHETALAGLQFEGADDHSGLLMLHRDALWALGREAEADALPDPEAVATNTPISLYLVAQSEMSRAHKGEHAAFTRAVPLFEKAQRLSRSMRPLYAYGLAHALGHTSGGPRALEVAETIEALWPEEPSALHWAGFARTAAGDMEHGQRLLQRAVELRPDSEVHRFSLAHASMGVGALEVAERLLREILRDDPDLFGANENLAIILRRRGDYASALEFARTGVRINGHNATSHWVLATTLNAAGRTREALPEFREALRLNPSMRPCRRSYAEALVRIGRAEQGLQVFREMLDEDPLDAMTWGKLGVFQYLSGDKEAALESLAEALRLDPTNPPAHVQLGLFDEQSGDWEAAGRHYEQALLGNPTEARIHYDLGCVHYHQGRAEEAIACFERAVARQPGLPEAHCNLGHALLLVNRYEAALDAFQRGHDLGSRKSSWKYPSDEWIQEAEQLIAVDARLSEVLADPSVASALERAELARHAVDTQRGTLALPLFESALLDRPDLGESRGRLYMFAARAAMAASRAAGVDQATAAGFRERALGWLSEDLAVLELGLVEGTRDIDEVIVELDVVPKHADFTELREAAALELLTEDEAENWRFFWEAVDGLRAALAEEAVR